MTDDSAVPLPCPNVLCQSKNILVWQSDMRKKHIAWSVMCRDCGASVGQRYDTEAEAIAAWNTRQPTQSEALTAENERLREALGEVSVLWRRHKYSGDFDLWLNAHIRAALGDTK